MKFGCHAVMFGPKLATNMEEVIKDIATTGFSGIECGNRFISLDMRDKLMDLLAQNGLELGAIHFAGMEWKTDPQVCLDGIRAEAAYMSKTANKNINMSFMITPEDAEKLEQYAATFEEAAKIAASYGVSLNYHNHLSEFANNAEFIHILLEEAPDLNFAYDLGWAKRAGYDPIKLLEETGSRCNYVHLRDPKQEVAMACTLDQMMKMPPFPEFGEGETDLKPQIDYLLSHFNEKGWAIVEHEGGAPDVQRYIKAKKVLDALL